MGYEVINTGEETLIKGADLQVRVCAGSGYAGSAFALGNLYVVKGGFMPSKVYVFEVLNEPDVSLEALKKVMDFFFSVLLDTEWYIKEIPPASALFAQEAERWYGKEAMEELNGTVGLIRAGQPD